ncbi:RNA polymerase sigma factor [Azorhizobium caulinodans]
MSASINAIFIDQRAALVDRVFLMVGCRQTAEDLVQECYLRTVDAAHRAPISHVRAFLYQTARNLALDHLRRERRRRTVEHRDGEGALIEQIADTSASSEQQLIDIQRMRALEAALEGLPLRAQQAVILNRLQGWSYPRIAEHLGVSPNTVYNDIRAAMSQCMKALNRLESP